MDSSAKYELASIKRELSSIIDELSDISNGVRNDFVGIGSDQCANCIDRVIIAMQKISSICHMS